MKYMLSETAYTVLKWVGLALCPALAVLVQTVAPAWGWDAAPVVTTINAVGIFIAAVIGVSQATARPEE